MFYFANNIVGDDYLNYYYRKNRLFLYWHVGKFVFEYQKKYPNTYGKLSSFLQYYFGMTNLFSLKKIIEMERFYIYFPIYNNNLEKLDWDYYLELIKIKNCCLRMIYYKIAIFSECDFDTFKSLLLEKNFFLN